jgi:hypothetical protein
MESQAASGVPLTDVLIAGDWSSKDEPILFSCQGKPLYRRAEGG